VDRFAGVRALLTQSLEKEIIAGGSVMIIEKGRVVFQSGFGYADLEAKTPFEIETPAIIASISKPLLATGIYRFAESGRLDMEAPVSKYLPEFTGAKLESGELVTRLPTTVELLTHTAGLRFDDAPQGRIWFQDWTQNQSLQFVINKVAKDFPFKAQPGSKWAYSGIGTDIAARVAEVTSGQLRNAFLLQQVCEPLGMTHTYYRSLERIQQIPMPKRYSRNKKTGRLELFISTRPALPENLYNSSGGNIISTAADLARWLLMLRDKGIHQGREYLKPETFAYMMTPHSLGQNVKGGLFIRKKDDAGKPHAYGHTGSTGTNVWIDFKHDVIGIMLTQTSGENTKVFRLELEKQVEMALTQPVGNQ
jgi:CubicO group peptidase (beta-lactamase class C family)